MSEFSENGKSRRSFFRNSSAALLAGYAFTNRKGLAQTVQQPDRDRYQSITLNTHDYSLTGEIQERIDLPKDWEVDIHHMAGNKSKAKVTNTHFRIILLLLTIRDHRLHKVQVHRLQCIPLKSTQRVLDSSFILVEISQTYVTIPHSPKPVIYFF